MGAPPNPEGPPDNSLLLHTLAVISSGQTERRKAGRTTSSVGRVRSRVLTAARGGLGTEKSDS
jgi:hypothetical protein